MYENMWIVEKQEYDTCSVNTSVLRDPLVNRNLMICRNPLQLSYYEMVFRSNSPPGGLEFTPGITYYFIGKKEPPRRGGDGRGGGDSARNGYLFSGSQVYERVGIALTQIHR